MTDNVIDSRTSTAPSGFRQFPELNIGNGLNEPAGLPADLLRVNKVTRIVIGNPFTGNSRG